MEDIKYIIEKDGQQYAYDSIREARLHIKREPGQWLIRKDKYYNGRLTDSTILER